VLLHNFETDGAHLTYQRVLFLVSEILLAEERGGWFTLGVMIDIEEGATSHIIDMVWLVRLS
jgi:hypothetical protein